MSWKWFFIVCSRVLWFISSEVCSISCLYVLSLPLCVCVCVCVYNGYLVGSGRLGIVCVVCTWRGLVNKVVGVKPTEDSNDITWTSFWVGSWVRFNHVMMAWWRARLQIAGFPGSVIVDQLIKTSRQPREVLDGMGYGDYVTSRKNADLTFHSAVIVIVSHSDPLRRSTHQHNAFLKMFFYSST